MATIKRSPSISAQSLAPSFAPSYSTEYNPGDIEMSRMDTDPTADAAEAESPPAYSPSTNFIPTVQLQIQTTGKPWLSLPLPPKPEPLPIHAVTPTGEIGNPAYVSLRFSRSSGNCTLVAGDDDTQRAVSTTTYRFGPGRHPRVRLVDPRSDSPTAQPDGEDEAADTTDWDSFELVPRGLLTRALGFKTRLGTFEWRYATRRERKALGVDSLLVLDRVVRVFGSQTSGSRSSAKEEEVRTPVARLLRNAELRTPGSGAASAGNGGRLLMDLNVWSEQEKLEREMMVVLTVTTAVAMLKREVDRRRAQQIAIMAGAASGGGP